MELWVCFIALKLLRDADWRYVNKKIKIRKYIFFFVFFSIGLFNRFEKCKSSRELFCIFLAPFFYWQPRCHCSATKAKEKQCDDYLLNNNFVFCSLFLCSISLVVVLTRDLTESSEREDVTNFFLFPFQLGLFREWRQLSSTLLYFYLWPVNFQVVIGSHNNFLF